MDIGMILARLAHVVLGAFWAGTMIFNAAFLLPSMRDAGPEAAKVAAGLMRRRFLDVMPAAAILTIVSGFYLFWRVSAGFAPAYMGAPAGMVYGLGAVAGLVALALGLGVMRPAMLRASALAQSAGASAPEAREVALAEAQRLRTRAAGAGRIVAWLLAAALITMAVARYV